MKTNLSFYSRRTDSHRHPKFKMLRQLYGGGDIGWAYEGRFWALNDIIADSELCQLDISIPRNRADISETLGLGLQQFNQFIEALISEDVQLLYEIEPQIYSTKKVKDTLTTVLLEREKSRKRRGTPEKDKNSPELFENSPEQNHKVKESKGEESKGKERDSSFSPELLNLFKTKTKILNPSFDYHLKPILDILEEPIPEHLSFDDIKNCIQEAFEPLINAPSIRIDYLCSNIRNKIIAKREQILNTLKQPELKEATQLRAQAAKDQVDSDRLFATQKLKEYAEFFTKNPTLFSAKEKVELARYLKSGEYLGAGRIIEPKIAEVVEL